MLKQKELYDYYIEDQEFEEQFDFLGNDGRVYTFHSEIFCDFVKNYGESNMLEVLQGDLEGMLSRKIITLIEIYKG